MSDAPLLAVEGLAISYRAGRRWAPVLHGIDLVVRPGEIVGLVGESGSGKSTLAFALLRHLAATARITAGRILFEGEDIAAASPARLAALRGRKIAMLFQDPSTALNPTMRLGAQVAETLRHHRGLGHAAAERETEALLASLRIAQPGALMARFAHEVSGGEKQRVVLAMALAGAPSLLVMDEPTTALDATTAREILALVQDLAAQRGLGVLHISHDLGTIARIAARTYVIYAGTIVEEGPTQAVLGRPAHVYTRLLMASLPNPLRTAGRRRLIQFDAGPQDDSTACRFAPRCPLAEPACTTTPARLEAIPAGPQRSACRRATEAARFPLPLAAATASARQPGRTLLQASDVTVRYRGSARPAVADVSLAVAAGETLGLVGESASGKSSLARALIGLVPATGHITLAGQPIAALHGAARRTIQIVFQHPEQSLNPTATIGASLARPLALYEGLRGRTLRHAVAAWLARVRLPAAYADRYPHELSGGEKQRVCIARAFAARPALVLCDEITTGLDASVQASTMNLLTELQAKDGTALLMISHDLNLVQHFADRIAVMHRGHLVELRPAFGSAPPPYHPYTELLLAAMPVADPGFSARPVTRRADATPAGGCLFAGACPRQPDGRCAEPPPIRHVGEDHFIRCHLSTAALNAMEPIWHPA